MKQFLAFFCILIGIAGCKSIPEADLSNLQNQEQIESTTPKVSLSIQDLITRYEASKYHVPTFDAMNQEYYLSLVAHYVRDAKRRLRRAALTGQDIKQLVPILTALRDCALCMELLKDYLQGALPEMISLANEGDVRITGMHSFQRLSFYLSFLIITGKPETKAIAEEIRSSLLKWEAIPRIGHEEKEALAVAVKDGRLLLSKESISNKDLLYFLEAAIRASNNWQQALIQKIAKTKPEYGEKYDLNATQYTRSSNLKTVLSLPDYAPLLPVFGKITIKDLNDISPYPMFAIGLTHRTRVEYDGLVGGAHGYTWHDAFHVAQAAKSSHQEFFPGYFGAYEQRLGQLAIPKSKVDELIDKRKAVYDRFTSAIKTLKQEDQDYAHLLWFAITHEALDRSLNFSVDADIENPISFLEYVLKSFEVLTREKINIAPMAKKTLQREGNIDFDKKADLKKLKEMSEFLIKAIKPPGTDS